jgi:hypothetical protein
MQKSCYRISQRLRILQRYFTKADPNRIVVNICHNESEKKFALMERLGLHCDIMLTVKFVWVG